MTTRGTPPDGFAGIPTITALIGPFGQRCTPLIAAGFHGRPVPPSVLIAAGDTKVPGNVKGLDFVVLPS